MIKASGVSIGQEDRKSEGDPGQPKCYRNERRKVSGQADLVKKIGLWCVLPFQKLGVKTCFLKRGSE